MKKLVACAGFVVVVTFLSASWYRAGTSMISAETREKLSDVPHSQNTQQDQESLNTQSIQDPIKPKNVRKDGELGALISQAILGEYSPTPNRTIPISQSASIKEEVIEIVSPNVPMYEAGQIMQMRFQNRKIIKRILVKPGTTVGEGDLLAFQDYSDLTAELAAKQAELEGSLYAIENPHKLASAKYEIGHTADALRRTQWLTDKRAASEVELGNAKRAHIQSKLTYENLEYEKSTAKKMIPKIQAEIDSLKVRIEERKMYAPFSGEIGIIELVEGEIVELENVLTLYDLSQVKAKVDIESSLTNKYPWWRDAIPRITVDGQTFIGKVVFIDETVVGTTRTMLLIFDNVSDQNGQWLIKPTKIQKLELVRPGTSSSEEQIAYRKK